MKGCAMPSLYEKGLAVRIGCYRSKLEQLWSEYLQAECDDVKYIDGHWADFCTHGRYHLEVKPHVYDRARQLEYVQQAADRLPLGKSVLIACGEPQTNTLTVFGARRTQLFDPEIKSGYCPYWSLLRFRSSPLNDVFHSETPQAELEKYLARGFPKPWTTFVEWSTWLRWPVGF